MGNCDSCNALVVFIWSSVVVIGLGNVLSIPFVTIWLSTSQGAIGGKKGTGKNFKIGN
jgi:hypothetical protein